MKKYQVTFYYHTNCVVNVEAENEREAKLMAYSQLESDEVTKQLMDGLEEDDSPDINEI